MLLPIASLSGAKANRCDGMTGRMCLGPAGLPFTGRYAAQFCAASESDALRQEFANLFMGFSLSSSSAGYGGFNMPNHAEFPKRDESAQGECLMNLIDCR